MRTKTKLYLALQAAVCIALAVLLSAAAIDIYLEGSARKAENPMESIFTPEAVSGKLASITPLLLTEIVLLAAGLMTGVKNESGGKPGRGAKPRSERLSAEKAASAAARKPAAPPKKTAAVQTVLLIAALILIIAGVLNGSALDVLYKAITICSECVGLG